MGGGAIIICMYALCICVYMLLEIYKGGRGFKQTILRGLRLIFGGLAPSPKHP